MSWEVKKNAHPNCNMSPWGWIEGAPGHICWSGHDGLEVAKLLVKAANAAFADRDATIADLRKQLDHAVEINGQLSNEAANLRAKLENEADWWRGHDREKQAVIQRLTDEKAALEAQLAELRIRYEGRGADVAGLLDTIQSLERDSDDLQREADGHIARIEQLERENDRLRGSIEQLCAERDFDLQPHLIQTTLQRDEALALLERAPKNAARLLVGGPSSMGATCATETDAYVAWLAERDALLKKWRGGK